MITVAILINGNPIMARSAVNKTERNDLGETKYVTDCGTVIWHHHEAGAVPLAHKMLDAIIENGVDGKNVDP
jgi:hypothetical protein